jgi:serine/threonine-protein kinase
MSGSELLGRTIGHVRIVDHLGQGGMGSIYIGYDEKLGRKVALKAIRGEHRLDPEAKARFLREARVLSQLDHPNICRIHDYIEGEDADFLVLELIAGHNLTDMIRAGKAGMEQKLHIAEQLLEVLAITHESGVIHRDIKPANIMLTETGSVKVLDFGLARSDKAQSNTSTNVLSTEAQSNASTMAFSAEKSGDAQEPTVPDKDSNYYATRLGTIVGTLAYMSPEQARGEFVTPASDMYSCGLVLQELFTGHPPFDLKLPPQQLLVRAREAVSAPVSGLGTDLTALINRLKSPSPGARPSASDALEKLRMIQAAPSRRRRRQAFVAGFACLAILSTALAIQTWRAERETRKAKQEAETATKVSQFLMRLFKVSDPNESKGNTVTARELLDKGARQLDTELGDQPLVKARLQYTIGRVYEELGLYQQGMALLESALAIREKALGPDHPDVGDTLNDLGTIADEKGDYDQAERLLKRVLAIYEKALGPDHPNVAGALHNLAITTYLKGDYDQAEQLYKRALTIDEKTLGPNHPQVADTLNNLAVCVCYKGDYDQAEQLFKRALTIKEKTLGPNHPKMAEAFGNLGMIALDKGDYDQAEQLYKRALTIDEKTLGPNHPNVAETLSNLGIIAREKGDYDQAEQLYKRALAIREKVLGPDHPDVAITLQSMAWLRRNEGIDEEAEQLARRALAIREKALGLDNDYTIESLLDVTDVLRRRGRLAEALVLSERALASHRNTPTPLGALDAMRASLEAGLLADERGDIATAHKLWQEGLAKFGQYFNDVRVRPVKVRLLLLLGRRDEARALLGRAEYAWDVELIPLARANGITPVEPRR